jgi:hypothetical protein
MQKTDEWTRPFYEKGNIRERERLALMYREE